MDQRSKKKGDLELNGHDCLTFIFLVGNIDHHNSSIIQFGTPPNERLKDAASASGEKSLLERSLSPLSRVPSGWERVTDRMHY